MDKAIIVFTVITMQTLAVASAIHLQSFDVAKCIFVGFLFADVCGALAWSIEEF